MIFLNNHLLFYWKLLLTALTATKYLKAMPFNGTPTELFFKIIHWTHMDFFCRPTNGTYKVVMMPNLALTTMKTEFHFSI